MNLIGHLLATVLLSSVQSQMFVTHNVLSFHARLRDLKFNFNNEWTEVCIISFKVWWWIIYFCAAFFIFLF